MKKSEFYFDLPPELIAQTPIEPRDHSRLLHLNKISGEIYHRHFYDIIDLLNEGDLLVVNNSRVIPARLYGTKKETGANIEFLLLEQKQKNVWEILVKPGKKARVGAEFIFGDGILHARITDVLDGGNRLCEFTFKGNFFDILDKIGQMPLPHYITEHLDDNERYQTVYSKELGSAAAPTAGLHFTPELMDKLHQKGVQIAYVTLHVGLGTFRPVKADDITQHTMHSEHYSLPQETADLINRTKQSGKRVIAVGTTSCRTIESVAAFNGEITAAEGYTNIFIYPGYEFKVLDGLITNFHLPESTLIMLVSAFAGYESTMNAYHTAVNEKYRFFSFGDAMMIL
ncbi:MAG: queA [Oscillospiraceae bacterium]|nr:queA [Oscillospiraceae bacterium]